MHEHFFACHLHNAWGNFKLSEKAEACCLRVGGGPPCLVGSYFFLATKNYKSYCLLIAFLLQFSITFSDIHLIRFRRLMKYESQYGPLPGRKSKLDELTEKLNNVSCVLVKQG